MPPTKLTDKRSREAGQGLVEYALILVLVAIVMIVVLLMISPQVKQSYCVVVAALQRVAVTTVCP